MPVELLPVKASDWHVLREVRLKALADSPDAFGTTVDQALALSDAEWRERAGGEGLTLVALLDGVGVGMGGAVAPPGRPSVFIWGMWVDASARGLGVGSQLLDKLVAWCRGSDQPNHSYPEVRLHVTEGNTGARRLYVRHGFRPTGAWESLREGSPLRIEELVLTL
jgi:GNAT superfamily N-acetyltransferase